MSTAYHVKYFAYELAKRCASDSVEKLAASLANAQVDLNPHEVEEVRGAESWFVRARNQGVGLRNTHWDGGADMAFYGRCSVLRVSTMTRRPQSYKLEGSLTRSS